MEKIVYPHADRRCVNCKFYEVVTNVEAQQQVMICRMKPPKQTAQLTMQVQQDPKTGQPVQVPRWATFTLWPIVGPNDWCGSFVRELHSVSEVKK